MEEKSKFEKLQFATREEFVKFLKSYFSEIGKLDELILFAHQVNDWNSSMVGSDPIEKVNGILRGGLSGSSYGSSDGTLNKMGSILDEKTIDRILDYDYHNYKKHHEINTYPTVILAFPKKVKVNAEDVDFVDSAYTRDKENHREKLNAMFKSHGQYGLSDDPQFAPKTWLDVLNGFSNYAMQDNFLAFYQDENGEYHVIVPHTHWVNEGKDAYAEHKAELAKKIIAKGADLDTALVKKAKDYQCTIDDYLNEI